MTNEHAVKILKEINHNYFDIKGEFDDFNEAINVAIKTLEKKNKGNIKITKEKAIEILEEINQNYFQSDIENEFDNANEALDLAIKVLKESTEE